MKKIPSILDGLDGKKRISMRFATYLGAYTKGEEGRGGNGRRKNKTQERKFCKAIYKLLRRCFINIASGMLRGEQDGNRVLRDLIDGWTLID